MWPLSAAQSTSAMICPKTPSRAAAMKSHYPSRPGNATAWSSTQASRLIMSTWRWKMALSPLLSTWALEPSKPLWNQWTESSTTTRGMTSKSPATSGRWVHCFGYSTNDLSGFGSTDMWFKTVGKVAKQNSSETQMKFNNWISMAKKSGKQLLAVSSVLSSTRVCVFWHHPAGVWELKRTITASLFLHLFFLFLCWSVFDFDVLLFFEASRLWIRRGKHTPLHGRYDSHLSSPLVCCDSTLHPSSLLILPKRE